MFTKPLLSTYFALYKDKVRVRFAPSNTGYAHAGSIRSALFNYLFAKKNNGTFILRIEDTDQTRTIPGTDKYIVDALHWLGIDPDDGFDAGISPGSDNYVQSKRAAKGIYKEYAEYLIQNGYAYYCFDTPEEIAAMKQHEKDAGVTMPSYNHSTRRLMGLKNSFTLSVNEVENRLAAGEHYTIRFKFDNTDDKIIVEDLIRGTVEFITSNQDDKILLKSDGMPTYHLANVVDDLEMGISHVIRGEEWLSSCALHVSLYKAFGYEDRTPKFAHIPLILKPNGEGKLSKRDGISLGIPIFPFECTDPESGKKGKGYREEGFFPQAVINHLALIGWNPGGGSEKEMFTLDELVQSFSLEGVNKAGARYNHEKAVSFNKRYLQVLDNNVLAQQLIDTNDNVKGHSLSYVASVIAFLKDRVNFVSEIYEKGKFFFVKPEKYDMEFVSQNFNEQTRDFLNGIYGSFAVMSVNMPPETISSYIDHELSFMYNGLRLSKKTAIQLLNVVMTGEKSAPDIAKLISTLTIHNAKDRITDAIHYFEKELKPQTNEK